MYTPKHGFESGSEDHNEYFPMRALSDQEQTFIDTMIAIDGSLPDKGFGYFVSFDRYGGPCVNSVYGINYPTKV
mgnify:CR=1 FL=1|jgi:hypothetical protein